MKNGPIQPLLLWFLLIVHALGFIFHKTREATVCGGDALLLIFQFVCFFPCRCSFCGISLPHCAHGNTKIVFELFTFQITVEFLIVCAFYNS